MRRVRSRGNAPTGSKQAAYEGSNGPDKVPRGRESHDARAFTR